MPSTIARTTLLIILLTLTACGENSPEVDWELTIDGDVNQPVTYTYQDLVGMRRAKLTDVITQNPENPSETTSWEGAGCCLAKRWIRTWPTSSCLSCWRSKP